MVLTTIRTYLLTYLIWRIVTYTVENGEPDRSVVENLYAIVSGLCNAISDLHVDTEEDEALIQNTVKILQLSNGTVTHYPLKKLIVKSDDVLVKWYLIFKSPGNDTNKNDTTNATGEIYLWFPKNESLMKLDENGTEWIPANNTLVRQRRSEDSDQFILGSTENTSKWYPVNDKLLNLHPWNQSQNNMSNLYTKDEPGVSLKNYNFDSFPINKSSFNQSYDEDYQNLDTEKHHWPDLEDYDERQINWYYVNDTYVAIKVPDINVNRGTKLIIHGFGATAEDVVTNHLAYVYYKFTNFNVLLLDAALVLGKIYFKSVKNARLLGKAIADVIIYLESFGADAADFHLLGVSLGAHVAGWAGQYFRHIKGRRIGRITGLDPAGPCFAYMPANDRLDKSDALYVDVIHTNTLVEGISESIGHSDFFVNGGGPVQPGCFLPACSHLYAAYVFKLSVLFPDLFISVKCDSWSQFHEEKCFNKTALMGEKSDPGTRGLYYIRTSKDVPYGLGIDGISPKKYNV